ncbi:hypothetical protein CSUI_005291 [Cystoisospora suis]|uniref:Uncharacterized protein n=1 Tax=Cystoisospora suis TaxID=483139 RepID=A0A2C6KYJ4_9APIC|nr:hypothetical protein CSUI_005291 [Cystoisospora suis]
MSVFKNFLFRHPRGFLGGDGGGPLSPRGTSHSMSRRFFSGGAAKPSWAVPQHQRFGPTLPDNAYYGEHATYNYFVLFIRGLRPYLEKILEDCALTIKKAALSVYCPFKATVVKHNPEFRLQAVAFGSFLVTHMAITSRFNEMYQRLVDVTSLLEVRAAQDHGSEGFWQSASEQQEETLQKHAEHHRQLEEQWDQALREATVSRSFDVLIKHLAFPGTSGGSPSDPADAVPGREAPTGDHEDRSTGHGCAFTNSAQEHDHHGTAVVVPPTVMWNFNAMPYGRDNPDTKTFPIPHHEQVLSFPMSLRQQVVQFIPLSLFALSH